MIGDGNPIDLHKLPLADLLSYLEMNPPAIPWNALTNVPFKGVPLTPLEKHVSPGETGFVASLGGKLDPANYQHLLLINSIQSGGAPGNPNLTFNGDTGFSGTNYQYAYAGTSASSATGQPGIILPAGASGSGSALRASSAVFIPNFLESIEHTVIGICGDPGVPAVYVFTGAHTVAAPITEFGVSFANNLAAGSTFTAYALGSQS